MSSRTVLGFDFGTKRIGIAVGQEITRTAKGITTLKTHQREPDWEKIDHLIREWQPQLLVVGMPHNMDDRPHPLEKTVENFGNHLKQRYNLPLEWMDERLSSVEAEQRLAEQRQSKHIKSGNVEIDTLAAEIILQSWFNCTAN